MGILFNAAELRREIEAFKHLTRHLIDPSAGSVLGEFEGKLQQLLRLPGTPGRWEIERHRPIITVPSEGDHEPERKGKKDLFGQFSCVWQITPVRSRNRTKGDADQIEVTGIASAELMIRTQSLEFARWTIEIASDGAPGTFFHTQLPMSGQAIPRLPAYAVSPLGALEFLLAEVFRSRWPEALKGNAGKTTQWSKIQSGRLRLALEWAVSEVTRGGSPIVALQTAVPNKRLFLAGR